MVRLVGFLFLFPSFLWSAESLSLAEVKRLVAESPRMSASRSQVAAAEAQQETTKGLLYPSLALSEGFLVTNDPVGVFSSKLQQKQFTAADFGLAELNDPESTTHWRTRLEVAVPVFHSLTDWRRLDAAGEALRAESKDHEYRLQLQRREAISLYYESVSALEQKQIVTEGIDLLARLEKSYQLMSSPTAATTTNYLITQSIRLSLTAQRSALETRSGTAKRHLLSILGRSPYDDVTLSDPLPSIDALEPNGKRETPTRPDVEAAQGRAQAAQWNAKALKASYGPNVDARAGYNLYTGDFSEFEDSYDAGLQLVWPLFEGPRGGRFESAKAEAKAARLFALAVKREAEASRESAVAELRARIDEHELLLTAERKASEAIALARRRYAEGILSLFDYSQSIQNWVSIRKERVEAQRRGADARAALDLEEGAL